MSLAVCMITSIVFLSRLSPTVKRVRYVSSLSSRTETTIYPYITFLLSDTLREGNKMDGVGTFDPCFHTLI